MFSRLQRQKFALIPLILHYIVLSLFIGLLHHHECDNTFHDNCPACQWETQSQFTDNSLSDIQDLLDIHLNLNTSILSSMPCHKQAFELNGNVSPRAPPSFI